MNFSIITPLYVYTVCAVFTPLPLHAQLILQAAHALSQETSHKSSIYCVPRVLS